MIERTEPRRGADPQCLARLAVAAAAASFALLAGVAQGADGDTGAPPGTDRATLAYDGIPVAARALEPALAGSLAARDARPVGWTTAGGLVVATRFGETRQLHLVERAGGARRQITFGTAAVLDAAVSPDPVAVNLAIVSTDTADQARLSWLRLDRPEAQRPALGIQAEGAPLWSNDGHRVAIASNARDPASRDVVLTSPDEGAAPRLLVSGEGGDWEPLDWSPDDRKLLVLKHLSALEGHLYVVDVESGERREIDAGGAPAAVGAARFARDGQGVFLTSDRGGGSVRLWFVNFFTGERSALSAAGDGDVDALALSRDGRHVAYASNEAGTSRLHVLDWPSRQEAHAPRLPAGGVVSDLRFDPSGDRLAFAYASATTPRDAYVLEVADGRVEAWTHSEPGAVEPSQLVVPRLVEWPTFDRDAGGTRRIPALFYAPASPGPHPVVVLFADAPHAQFRPVFDPWVQYLVRVAGYVVVTPNLRGASGYGRDFAALDARTQRDAVVKDIGALLVWIGAQPECDRKRIAVAGTGYGGYLALAALANFGDRLRGAVDIAGISDLVGFLAEAAPENRAAWRAELGDERDPDTRAFLRRISPLTDADRINRPLLVVHGERDRAVPLRESTQLVNRLRARGAEVWLLTAGDEGHVWRRQTDRLAQAAVSAHFLEKVLKSPTPE